jgi:hypothetical protein
VVAALEELGVRYHIGGSVASSAHGIARATVDVDLVVELPLESAHPLTQRLAPAFYVDEESIRSAIRDRESFNLIHLATMVKVDVYVSKDRPFDRQAQDRARPERLHEDPGSRTFYVESPEDVILSKLQWYRAGGEASRKQWSDVVGVLKAQAGSLDLAHLTKWAAIVGVSDLVSRALRESGLDEPRIP